MGVGLGLWLRAKVMARVKVRWVRVRPKQIDEHGPSCPMSSPGTTKLVLMMRFNGGEIVAAGGMCSSISTLVICFAEIM